MMKFDSLKVMKILWSIIGLGWFLAVFFYYIKLGASRDIPFLSEWSWLSPRAYAYRYSGHIKSMALFSALIFLGGHQIRSFFDQLFSSSLAPQIQRRIAIVLLMMVACVSWRVHLGFYNGGVPGWDYSAYGSAMKPIRDEDRERLQIPQSDPWVAIAQETVNTQWIREIGQSGVLVDKLMLLEFTEKRYFPVSRHLSHLSFPQFVFGDAGQVESERYFKLMKRNFRRQRDGRRFLIPRRFALPYHASYPPTDYQDYPPVEELVGWHTLQVEVVIDGERAKVTRAVPVVSLREDR